MPNSIDDFINHSLGWPLLEDLAVWYSPNHTNTTEIHTRNQIKMTGLLAQGDYGALNELTGLNENETIRVSDKELEDFFGELTQGLNQEDYKLLIALAAVHDIGKQAKENSVLAQLQSKRALPLADHAKTGELLLKHNPELLSPFFLEEPQKETILLLVKYHLNSGGYFFGGTTLNAYAELMSIAKKQDSKKIIQYQLIHGMLDVMSVRKNILAKSILKGHRELREQLFEVYNTEQELAPYFEKIASNQIQEWGIAHEQLNPTSLWRLYKVMGSDEEAPLQSTLDETKDKISEDIFNACNRGIGEPRNTFYLAYMRNAFGSRLYQTLVKAGEEKRMARSDAFTSLVTMIALAEIYAQQQKLPERQVLSARGPSLAIAYEESDQYIKNAREMRDVIKALPKNLELAVEKLSSGKTVLGIEEKRGAIEITYASLKLP